jgi:DNA-binding NarL/FixJ family response regulator
LLPACDTRIKNLFCSCGQGSSEPDGKVERLLLSILVLLILAVARAAQFEDKRLQVSSHLAVKEAKLVPIASMRILVADDLELWRRSVRSMLGRHAELQLVGEVADGLVAVQEASKLKPDLILLDVGLPSLNGIEAAKRIRQVVPVSKILFLTASRGADVVEAALSSGGKGCVLKTDAGSELWPAIESVLQGEQYFSSGIGGLLGFKPTSPDCPELTSISPSGTAELRIVRTSWQQVLSVSYDRLLLETRHGLLESRGYSVASARRLSEALDYCNSGTQFDLFILCHSIPDSDKEMLIKAFRANHSALVLGLKRRWAASVRGADLVIDPDPRLLLRSVATIVRGKGTAA